ncbi:MAG: hypothetical protein ABEN55_20360 [Bradymonadaceae bacterium]
MSDEPAVVVLDLRGVPDTAVVGPFPTVGDAKEWIDERMPAWFDRLPGALDVKRANVSEMEDGSFTFQFMHIEVTDD